MIDVSEALDLARRLASGPKRTIVGITGPPGSGKSTLAAAMCEAAGRGAALVPMDGFHLADSALDVLGLRDRKGAPETFDSFGYAALLGRLHTAAEPVVYAPAFERGLEQPIAGAIAVDAHVRLVVTEGNYLLCDDAGWPTARRFLTQVLYCELEEQVRLERLIARHVQFGKTPDEARAWVESVDQPNARLIERTRSTAGAIVPTRDVRLPG